MSHTPPYRFEFHNRDGSVDTYDLGRFEDDRSAQRAAREALLVSQCALAVDIWRDHAPLARLKRDGSA